MYVGVDGSTEIVRIHFRLPSLRRKSSYSTHNTLSVPEEEPSTSKEDNDGQYHYDEEEEVLEVLRVVCAVRHVLVNLAEVALEAFAALAGAVQADSAIHALA